MKYRYVGIIAIVCLLIGRFVLQPKANIEIKEKIKIVEVIKEVKVEVKSTKRKETTTKKPDGTVIVVVDESINSKIDTKTDTSKVVTKDRKTLHKSGVIVGLLALKDLNDFNEQTNYGLTVTAPIYNSLKIQAVGTSDKQIGLGLALEF